MIIAEYYSGIDGKFVKTHMCKGQKSRCRECKKKLFLCKSCAGVHVPLLGWYPSWGLWFAGHGPTSLSSISLSLSPFLLPFFVSSTPLVLCLTGFLKATQALEMDGSSTGRKEGFKASERYPGRYPSIPRAIPQNGENSPLPVMRWGSHHFFFCFLPPLICSSLLSLSRPAALVKYLQDETASKRAFLQDSSRWAASFFGAEGYGEAANSMVRKAEATHPWQGQRPLRGHGSKSWMKRTKNLDLQDLIFVRAILRRRIDAFKKWVPGLCEAIGKIEER